MWSESSKPYEQQINNYNVETEHTCWSHASSWFFLRQPFKFSTNKSETPFIVVVIHCQHMFWHLVLTIYNDH